MVKVENSLGLGPDAELSDLSVAKPKINPNEPAVALAPFDVSSEEVSFVYRSGQCLTFSSGTLQDNNTNHRMGVNLKFMSSASEEAPFRFGHSNRTLPEQDNATGYNDTTVDEVTRRFSAGTFSFAISA